MASRTLIIAEAGVNHNGDLGMAKELVHAAAEAGADCVKFQTFRAGTLARRDAPKAAYQLDTAGDRETQFQMLRRLELDRESHEALFEECQRVGIEFLSSPFSVEDLELLLELGINRVKLPSGELTNYQLLRKASESELQVLLSTGMATLGEVEEALALFGPDPFGGSRVTLLHCTTQYPTPYDQVNLRAMQTMANAFAVPVGLSDHTQGISVCVAAVALGASVIEKHFTLDRTLPGPDHRASLEPVELGELVTAVRQVEQSLGDGLKKPAEVELDNRKIVRKSLFLAEAIQEGETFADHHIEALRPGDGISPMAYSLLVGRTAATDLPAGHKLRWSDFA